jgi:rRNA maturation RNase YbeY
MIASCPGFKSDNFILFQSYKAKFTELHLLTNFEIMLTHLSSKVNFFSDGVKPNIKNRMQLKVFIEFIFKNEKSNLQSLNYVFCTDKRLRKINKQYLNHDYFTDIITFNLSGPNKPIVSEIYISIERIKENAKSMGITYKSELHRVLFHGVLHLCGYSDKNPKDKIVMRAREDFYLIQYL